VCCCWGSRLKRGSDLRPAWVDPVRPSRPPLRERLSCAVLTASKFRVSAHFPYIPQFHGPTCYQVVFTTQMFPSLPSPHVCDHSSPSSIAIAQTVSRSWYNLDPRLWFTIPERITFHPDGTGVISSPYDIFSGAGGLSEVLSHSFTWKLERNGPLGMEEMDDNALFDTIPKLVSSSKAWTHKTWGGGVVPAYLHIDLVGTSSFESNPLPPTPDPFIINTSEATFFPPELLEYIFLLASEETVAARELLGTCRRAREMVMRRRRREMFPALAKRFASNGMVSSRRSLLLSI
jgi:hypothetical protein